MTTFDLDRFVGDCVEAADTDDPLGAVAEVVGRAVSDPRSVRYRFEVPLDPDDDGILHRSPGLFVTWAVFPRGFATGIHDHGVPAVIGGWAGEEANRLYRPTAAGLEACGSSRVTPGDVVTLDAETAHDVHVQGPSWSGALHVYLGDILTLDRHEWARPDDPATPFDPQDQERRWTAAAQATGLLAAPHGG